ncbi:MAG: hypothetical protein ACLQAT_17650 [Candidatus Binataceae bacterium]
MQAQALRPSAKPSRTGLARITGDGAHRPNQILIRRTRYCPSRRFAGCRIPSCRAIELRRSSHGRARARRDCRDSACSDRPDRAAQTDKVALSKLPPSDEPIFVTGPLEFLELSYYAPPVLRSRLIYPDCPKLDLKYLGSNSHTIAFEGLARRSPVKVEPCEALLSNRKAFKLVVNNVDYLVAVLSSQGRTVVPEDIGDKIIFDVGAAS